MNRWSSAAVCSMVCTAALFVSGCADTAPGPVGATTRTGTPDDGSPEKRPEAPRRSASSAPGDSEERDRTTTLPVAPGNTSSGAASVSRPSDGRPGRDTGAQVTLASYDAASGRAVVSHDAGSTAPLRKGDVVASPPTGAAPRGALFRVTGVRAGSDTRTEVTTAPAGLAEVLGDTRAVGSVPVPGAAWEIDPLVEGIDLGSRVTGRAKRDASGSGDRSLRIGFDTRVPMFRGKPWLERETRVGGFFEIAPEVTFAYDGRGTTEAEDATASVGVAGSYKSGWRIEGPVVAPRLAPRLPIAVLAAYPVVMVGSVPVVVSLKLRLVLEVRADGALRVDVEQTAGGSLRIGTRYSKASGWKGDARAEGKPVGDGTAEVTGEGDLRTMLGPEASIGLYDAVGIDAFFGPYLRVKARQPGLLGASDEGREGRWNLYGGVTLETSLFSRLPFTVLGFRPTPRLVFPLITKEWPIANGSLPPLP
ncbi:hypothetical protein [Streptomyces cadmiisoli]|nr:hypothetical protein [Streptomyces cadmiisoli]